MMNFRPSEDLSEKDVSRGLKLVIAEGMATESMVVFTGGAFLVAMAVHMGASNFQLGVLAALPTFSSIFQLVSIWLVQRFKNRRAIAVLSNFFARFPLIVIGLLPILFTAGTSIKVLIFLLFFHYYPGSIAGASWNSWMKDMVPAKQLGAYFSHRSRLTQSLNVILSLFVALSLDYLKARHPEYMMSAYSGMFLIGGGFGLLSVFLLSRTPEPATAMVNDSIFKLLKKPLKDKNFRSLLTFNSLWAFSLNLATPFFSVYMMKTIGLPLSYIIALGIVCQISSILSIKMWGRYSDRYSNKTIINICAPVYVICILSWAFVGMASSMVTTLVMLGLINIVTGFSTAGANLAISNISIKLAPKEEAIVYLTVKNISIAVFSTIAPMTGGLLADFFASHQLTGGFSWSGGGHTSILNFMDLQGWNFFFIIGGLFAMLSLRVLGRVKEFGEVDKDKAVVYIRKDIKRTFSREVKRAGLIGSPAFSSGLVRKMRQLFHTYP
ncbi:MFS transporter [Pararcticibacter amylolyticus]|uniref:MFS transporter n=1 Tax=Pararcticibacter amylolyticus TaxID=2173175 RepID=A0A2U2PLT0_9SPHI|nr:MFS transporter [Pararcticibacter amylolyticus]PWG82244.1 MFS transporter [Pararcticibacter amylolyticus]